VNVKLTTERGILGRGILGRRILGRRTLGRRTLDAVGLAAVCLVVAAAAHGQAGAPSGQTAASGQTQPYGAAASASKPVMSDQFFKNVQVLKGIPVDQFLGTMGFIAASLSVNCTECHQAAG